MSIIAVLVIAGAVTAFFVSGTSSTTNDDERRANENAVLDDTVNLNVETVDDNTNSEKDANADDRTLSNENTDEEILDVNTITLDAIKDVTYTTSGFSPKTLSISVGDTVLWTNATSGSVYIAPDDHPAHKKYEGVWDDTGEGNIASAEDYSFTFTTAGTYTYHNHLNSAQTGLIVVEPK